MKNIKSGNSSKELPIGDKKLPWWAFPLGVVITVISLPIIIRICVEIGKILFRVI